MDASDPKKARRLNTEQRFQICEWLKVRIGREDWVNGQLYHTELAALASNELGFQISDSSIAQIIKDGRLPIESRKKMPTRGSRPLPTADELSALTERVETLERRVAALIQNSSVFIE